MSWSAPATAVAGSVLTAAWLNTYLRDNLNILKTQINDDGTLKPFTRLACSADQGTDTSAGATNVATCAISGLTVLDHLEVLVTLESVTQQTAIPLLYSTTDSIQVGYLANNTNVAAAAGGTELVTLGMRQGSSTALNTYNSGGTFSNGSRFISGVFTLTTLWTNAWTLALRHGGVTAGGTFKWKWKVIKVAGQ